MSTNITSGYSAYPTPQSPPPSQGPSQSLTPAETAAASNVLSAAKPASDQSQVTALSPTPISPNGVDFSPQGKAVSSAIFAANFPESLPKATQVSYTDFSQKLNANPRVNYIEIDRKDLNKGLSAFLNHYQEALNANPELKAKLAQSEAGRNLLEALESASKGALGTDDIIKLQTFIVASGVDITHSNSVTGIDGDYGAKTHAGLQAAFASLLSTDGDSFNQFDSNYKRAYASAQNQRTDRQDMGNQFVPGQSIYSQTPTPGVSPAYDPPSSTDTGAAIVDAARKTKPAMARILAQLQAKSGRRHYRCYQGVKKVLNELNPPISLSGGSAYQADAQLRSKYADRFSDIKTFDPNSPATKSMLRNLPPGAIVVWGRNESASKRASNPNNGYSHGHISVALGGGKEYSDRDRSQITNNDGRYGSVTVFIPK